MKGTQSFLKMNVKKLSFFFLFQIRGRARTGKFRTPHTHNFKLWQKKGLIIGKAVSSNGYMVSVDIK